MKTRAERIGKVLAVFNVIVPWIAFLWFAGGVGGYSSSDNASRLSAFGRIAATVRIFPETAIVPVAVNTAALVFYLSFRRPGARLMGQAICAAVVVVLLAIALQAWVLMR